MSYNTYDMVYSGEVYVPNELVPKGVSKGSFTVVITVSVLSETLEGAIAAGWEVMDKLTKQDTGSCPRTVRERFVLMSASQRKKEL